MSQVLMPKATAVWLVENTTLTFDQISAFTGLHPLEIQAIADGEVAIGIVGIGMIGASVAAAVKARGVAARVVAYSPGEDAKVALAAGWIDRVCEQASDCLEDSELLVLSAPVSSIIELMPAIAHTLDQHLRAGKKLAALTDTGSSKQGIIEAAKALGLGYSGTQWLYKNHRLEADAELTPTDGIYVTKTSVAREAEARAGKRRRRRPTRISPRPIRRTFRC